MHYTGDLLAFLERTAHPESGAANACRAVEGSINPYDEALHTDSCITAQLNTPN